MRKPLWLAALKSAERFIEAEWKVRMNSYLPEPTEEEQRDLADCVETLEIVKRAIVQGEIEFERTQRI